MGDEQTGTPEDPGREAELHPDDRALLGALTRGNSWMRAILCTLARRGVQFRQASPGRAEQVLESLSTWPPYRAGQFAFDLLEVEDFMLDGEEPPLVPIALDAADLHRIAAALRSFQSRLDARLAREPATDARGRTAGDVPAQARAQLITAQDDEPLPPLEAGFYLYSDVVLGLSAVVGPLLAQLESREDDALDAPDGPG